MIYTNVLGTKYTLRLDDMNNTFLTTHDGICNVYTKEIIIREPQYLLGDDVGKNEQLVRFSETLRHELVHAFCKEAGVHYDDDENLVDWIAQMIPNMVCAYDDLVNQLKEQY